MNEYILTVWLIWGSNLPPEQTRYPDGPSCITAQEAWNAQAKAWLHRSLLAGSSVLSVSSCKPDDGAGPSSMSLLYPQ
jgi:hypothetical protein